jgi:signal transduction histidine kinase
MERASRGENLEPESRNEIVIKTESTTEQILANRFGLVSRLAEDLAHEIKNPLHSMAINLEVMRRRVTAGDQTGAFERAAVIDSELHRVNELVERLLRLVRPTQAQPRTTDVRAILDEVTPLLAVQAKLARIAFGYDPDEVRGSVAVPPATVKFALLNVAQEVLDLARAAGGALRISLEQGPVITVAAHLPDAGLVAVPPAARTSSAPGVAFAERLLDGSGGTVEHDRAVPGVMAVRMSLPADTSA